MTWNEVFHKRKVKMIHEIIWLRNYVYKAADTASGIRIQQVVY
jgi:hypothetical protein